MYRQQPADLTDHYQVLGVSFNASEDEIRRAYRRMAMQWHPDRNKSPDALHMMQKINEAWEVLGNPESKAEHDLLLRAITQDYIDTQLRTAIQENLSLQEISTLIDKGADVNACDNLGLTPLHLAVVSNGNPAFIDLLVHHGADVNARDKDGNTPLHHAAANNENPAVIETLMSRGAEINARDNDGDTPLDIANIFNKNPAVARLLQSRGAIATQSATATSSSGHCGIIETIRHTWYLMKMSWRLLMKDRELIFFPIFAMIGLALLAVSYPFLAEPAISDYTRERYTQGDVQTVHLGVIATYIVAGYFITIFFNAALVSAAIERLRGGDPDIASGITHAAKHIHHIFLWSVIVAIVMTILRLLRYAGRRFWPLAFIVAILRATWMLYTFFVIPVIVAEGHGPISGIRRSVNLVQQSWGQQVAAFFGFWFFYIVAGVLAAGLGFITTQVVASQFSQQSSVIVGMTVGAVLLIIEIALLQTLEGIFKAALYEYAIGRQPAGFDTNELRYAYIPATT